MNILLSLILFCLAFYFLLTVIIAPTAINRPRKPYTGAQVSWLVVFGLFLTVLLSFSGWYVWTH